MDNYAEQIVKRENTSSESTKKIGIIAAVIIICIILGLVFIFTIGTFISLIALILAAGAVYGSYILLEGLNVEYEYIMTNGELDVDKIIAKKKRKSLISIDLTKLEGFGKYSENIEEKDGQTLVISSDNIASHEYYADFKHDDYGDVRLIFAPNEKMLNAIKIYLPRNIDFPQA